MTESIPIDRNDDYGDDIGWLNVGDNGELADSVNICIERWRNAGIEAHKKMFVLFAIAGIFLVVCRHGHVLFVCDMIRSRELIKYLFALVNKLINTYGPDLGLAYDIACGFEKSIRKSSLGAKVAQYRLRGIVPAFHGHAHNCGCQVHWHPMYIRGTGIEDFEECE